MTKTLVMCIPALLCFGCWRSDISGPDELRASGHVVQVVLVEGFSESAVVLTTSNIISLGAYYDFRPFDSLWISFGATRLTSQLPFDEIHVRVGPVHDLRDSLYSVQKNVLLRVKVSDISKPNYCSLTFWATDPRAVIQLTDLRVIGWMTQ
jgi:hypothetical protein